MDSRLKSLIARVFDDIASSSLESNLESLSQVLSIDYAVFKDSLLTVIPQWYVALKFISSLSVTLAFIAKHRDFLKTDSVNCRTVTTSSFIDFIEGLMESALEPNIPQLVEAMKSVSLFSRPSREEGESNRGGNLVRSAIVTKSCKSLVQVRSDWFIYAILRCLPYVGRELYEKETDAFENILKQIGEYIAQRKKDYVELLQVWNGSPHEQEEYLECLWAQVQKLQEDDWKETHLKRYYVAFDGALAEAIQHNISSLSVPPHSPHNVYPLPSVIFRLFDYADCPDEGPLLPGAHSIERFLIEEDLRWTLEENIWNRKEWRNFSAMGLLSYQKRHHIPISYGVLEVVFSQLFRLPVPPTTPLFCGSLIIELCKEERTMPQVGDFEWLRLVNRVSIIFTFHLVQWCSARLLAILEVGTCGSLPRGYWIERKTHLQGLCLAFLPHSEQVVAQATELLYQRINTMQLAAIDQFVNWFSYHLSNFEYRWSWPDWSGCLKEDTLHPQQFFVREVSRFSFLFYLDLLRQKWL
ncbi:unnamed protein product [Toxocara canis]|uniref:Nuclear cap-binding protein subunit 1 n=1 Tax=Toxocara canis TaxID=6265 RepID=A0A183V8M4_TOXCA|nr:unnamed protein product [Toxocara canis]